ncbi:hypothetical protein GGI05_001459 [Coemansia sp. RSA 2603]|nr:hypothetical protein GGI05_001459 [Coemansia sp. RSA 2603]
MSSSPSIPQNGENRLPPNAQRVSVAISSGRSSSIKSHSGSAPRSLSQATELLISSSPPAASGLLYNRPENAGSGTDAVGDGDAGSNTHVRSEMVLSQTEAARRLKRHLVTRPLSGSQPRSYGSIASSTGYSGDEGENDAGDEDDSGHRHRDEDEEEVPVDPFKLPSGDITHHLYRWQQEHSRAESSRSGKHRHQRNRSFSAAASDSEWDVAYTPDQIRAPGGFRRQFVHARALQQRREANILTANFIDFIGLYGHFAGGDYPSDEDEDEAEDEHAPLVRAARQQARDIKATASPRKAFFLLVKSFVGTGVLVLPRAFLNGGLVFSTLLMSVIAWYALICMIMLSDVYLKIGGSYGDLALKLYGRPLKYSVMVSIVLAQLGFCCAYVIFVATNMRDLWDTLTTCRYRLPTEAWILGQLLVYVPLAFVRRIKRFASLSAIGNVFIMIGLAYLLSYDFWSIATRGPSEVIQFNPSKFPLLVGTAAFSYEGISLVIPIVESMEHKEKFRGVLTSSLVICAGLFVTIGALSYLTFGDSVETVILLNLPNGSVWTLGVQLLYSLAIVMSVPLQLFPAIRIIESGMFTRSGKGNPVVKWQKNLFRTLLVVFIAMVAIFGAEELDNFIAIVGASACVPLSFLYPVMLHYKALAVGWRQKAKDIVLIAVGLVGLVYVTYISVDTWGSTTPPIDRCDLKP